MKADFILDSAVEAEFILCFTSEQADSRSIGIHHNDILGIPHGWNSYQVNNTPQDLEDWVLDAQRQGGWTGLASDILSNLDEFSGTMETRFLRELVESLPKHGKFLSFEAVQRVSDEIQEIIGPESISYSVMPRLSMGIWIDPSSSEGADEPTKRISEPNVAVRLKCGDGKRIGRHVLEKISALCLDLLYQGEVATRLRTEDDAQWQLAFFKKAGVEGWLENTGRLYALDVDFANEQSLAFFTGSRDGAVRIFFILRATLASEEWNGMGMTLEFRPDAAQSTASEKHALLIRHGRRRMDQGATIGNLLYELFGTMVKINWGSISQEAVYAGQDLFLPVAHNCALDLGSYDDLACTAPGIACNRWSTRCGFAPYIPGVALRVTECHCSDGGHPRLVIGEPVDDSECVQVDLACCGESSCPRPTGNGRTWWLPIFPKQEVSQTWMSQRWGLDWLLQLKQASDEPAGVTDQGA
jgi:hypothetical protein